MFELAFGARELPATGRLGDESGSTTSSDSNKLFLRLEANAIGGFKTGSFACFARLASLSCTLVRTLGEITGRFSRLAGPPLASAASASFLFLVNCASLLSLLLRAK